MAEKPAYYFCYWGKAKPGGPEQAQFHLLVFHSLDVAATGVLYVKNSPALCAAFRGLLACSEAAMLSWLAFLLAVHDLGKCSEAFQGQREDLIWQLQQRDFHRSKQYSVRHDSLGFWMWNSLVEEAILTELGLPDDRPTRRAMQCWIMAVTGHHGTPPIMDGAVELHILPQDMQAARQMVLDLGQLLLTDEARAIPVHQGREFAHNSRMLSWWFAGVAVLADWLGSNTEFFHYREQSGDLHQYYSEVASPKAEDALRHSGVLLPLIEKNRSLQDLFPYIEDATPLQHWARSVELPPGPQIYLLEDVTGAGKTEAAVMLAYRLMAQGSAAGFFIGLPTMATANAMYLRLTRCYQQLFAGDASMTLAHRFKDLVETFAQSVLPETVTENDVRQLDETASVRCAAWLADGTKRALLASAGVGTIDQALLAVLHSKHQSLRLLGLYNKVLIIDEVHACDRYMQSLLEVLLEFHARTNGAVILLSATLPTDMKQALFDAYAKGRNHAVAPAVASAHYPLATYWREGGTAVTKTAFESRASVSRSVQVCHVSDPEIVFGYIRAALAQGLCVVWIRNTVADATDAYRRLAPSVPPGKITLFHARFAMHDRLEKEKQVLATFGPDSDAGLRRGQLMIATQVAEQSLDVDFDLLITDLAPVDRLLQRAGRLRRHIRDARGNRKRDKGAADDRGPPCMWVFGPAYTVDPVENWYGELFPAAQYVYQEHGQLWRTAEVLQQGEFSMPGDARRLIEHVFSAEAVTPHALQKSADKAVGAGFASLSAAQESALNIGRGYQRGDGRDWWGDAHAPSRLGEQTVEVMLARWVDGRLLRWVEGDWAHSMVKVAQRLLAEGEQPSDQSACKEYQRMRQTLPGQGKFCVLLALTCGDDGSWYGRGRDAKANSAASTWLYDEQLGLRQSDATKIASD